MKFKIEDIGVKDAGKGFARISSTIMHEIGIEPLDVVEIYGKRKSAIRIMPASDSNNDSIKIDGITRSNIKMSISESITIKKIMQIDTKKVVLSPTNSKSLLFNDEINFKKLDLQLSQLIINSTSSPEVGL